MFATFFQLSTFIFTFITGSLQLRKDAELTTENALKKSPWIIFAVIFIVILIAIFATAYAYDPLIEQFPYLIQLHAAWITWALIAFLFNSISGYTLALTWQRNHPQRKLLTFAVATLFLAGCTSYFSLLSTVSEDTTVATTKEGIVLQTTSSTCMAASLANVTILLNREVISEKRASEILKTTSIGTSPGQLRYALNKLGISFTQLRDSELTLDSVIPPAILFIDHHSVGPESHAVTYCGREAGQYLIWDPLYGQQLWSTEMAKKRWHGKAVSCKN